MTKHTKGPWRANVDDMGGVGESAYVTIDTGPLTTTIIRVMAYKPRSLDPLPYKENALLAAAAPDMKEALEVIRHQWAGHSEACAYYRNTDAKCDCDWPKIAAKCDAALAKAEGGE